MEYRRLGKSGLKLSAFSFGTMTFGMQLDQEGAEACLKTAYEQGVNFFDGAERYGRGQSEIITGRALKKFGWPRDSFCLSSKVFGGHVENPKPTQRGLSRKHVFEACDQALGRLGVDYLDLYFCHRPDPEVPIEETVRAMHDLIRMGKVLYWGTSEWPAAQLMEAYAVARQFNLAPPTMEQPQYNLLHRERVETEYAHLYKELGLGTTIWGPLASGLLTGKYNTGLPNEGRFTLPGRERQRQMLESEEGRRRIEKVKRLAEVADGTGLSITHLALAWCLKNPNVSTVMLGASHVDQLQDNLLALEAVERLDDGVMGGIEAALDGAAA